MHPYVRTGGLGQVLVAFRGTGASPSWRELALAICKLRQTIACTSAGGKGCLPLDTGRLARASRVQGELALATCKLRQTIACTNAGGKGCLPFDLERSAPPLTVYVQDAYGLSHRSS